MKLKHNLKAVLNINSENITNQMIDEFIRFLPVVEAPMPYESECQKYEKRGAMRYQMNLKSILTRNKRNL